MENSPAPHATLEVRSPDGSTRSVSIGEVPYLIGRGAYGNQFALADDRLSRKCAAVTMEGDRYLLEDRGNSRGVFVNGGKVSSHVLQPGDVISFGTEIPYALVFRRPSPAVASMEHMAARLGEADAS